MPKILALSFFPLMIPPRSGGEVRLLGLYNALSRDHSVVLLTSGHLEQEHTQTYNHNARFREVRVPKDAAFVEAWQRLSSEAGGGDLSAPALAASSETFGALHEAYLAEHGEADIIIHDSPFLVGYDLFLGFDGKPRIYNSYNVESDIYRELHKDSSSSAIHEVVITAEQLICRHANVVTVCSSEDGARLRALFGYDGPIEVVPNGIDRFSLPQGRSGGKGFVFIGSGHRPNRTAAEVIVNEIAPLFPNDPFHILGTCMEPGILAPNVTAHGMVDDATKRKLFASALAGLNPMAEGGGSSLKIADMAAHGLPLISTEMGVRGFDYVAGKHYEVLDLRDSRQAISSALAKHPRDLAQMGMTAARHIADNFTWTAIAARMSKCIIRAANEQQKRKTGGRYLVLNDYDPFLTVGGGATRIRELYRGVCESATIVMMCFSDGDAIRRFETFNGRVLLLAFPKTDAHREDDHAQAAAHYISTADIVAISQAPLNHALKETYQTALQFCDIVICEHPYMANLPRASGSRFVYSSQNFELGLKQGLLETHPDRDRLVAEVADIERFAVGCSELVVAVSQEDAEAFGRNFDLVAPTIVVPNGAEEPSFQQSQPAPMPGFNVCFLGSAHMPNIESAQYVINELAPKCPSVTFHIAGSVCECISSTLENVRIWGILTAEAKAALFGSAQLAINPMLSGSGSNVKVADYLKHGLPVLTTKFGARGYEAISTSDLILRNLETFASTLREMALQPDNPKARAERREHFANRLSMFENGREFASVLREKQSTRKKALFVTYRYNFPRRGGGEVYVNRLVEYLADAGFDVDVVSPKVIDIYDYARFSSDYPIGEQAGAIPTGNAYIRSAKFKTDPVPNRRTQLEKIWARQPDFEESLFEKFKADIDSAALCWGWTDFDSSGRWCLTGFGLYSPNGGKLKLVGHAPFGRFLRLESADHANILDVEVLGNFEIDCQIPAGLVYGQVLSIDPNRPDDVRPLGLYFHIIDIGSSALINSCPKKPWLNAADPLVIFGAMHEAAHQTREGNECRLTDVRGPYSVELEDFVATQVSNYDLVITHNCVFRTTTHTIAAARRHGVPSVLLPHAHFDDDYYHFPDILQALKDSALNLISPRAACEHLSAIGIENVAYHAPGVDIDEVFGPEDVAAFRTQYTSEAPFVILLGRKSLAKNYRSVIDAVKELRVGGQPALRLVMIGPDDDKLPIHEEFVDYLGLVERSVVRGALLECLALINMSSSESFGIVLLEAGLAGKPVIANAQCAAFVDIVQDGISGLLASPNQLVDKLGQLLGDPKERKRMGAAMQKTALQYNWNKMGKEFVEHCMRLTEAKK